MGVVDVGSKSLHVTLVWLPIVDAALLLVLLAPKVSPILAASIVLANVVSAVLGAA